MEISPAGNGHGTPISSILHFGLSRYRNSAIPSHILSTNPYLPDHNLLSPQTFVSNDLHE
jgi:hypothetical protein